MNLLITLLLLWAIVGAIVVVDMPYPDTKAKALYQILIGGPFSWALCLFEAYRILLRRMGK